MKKASAKGVAVILAAIMALCLCVGASADGGAAEIKLQIGNPAMTVDGSEREIDPGLGTAPINQNGRTLLPIRAVIEALGGGVIWDGETQTVILAYGSDIITMVVGSTTAFVNEDAQTLDAAPVIIDGRTMLPIRFVAEGFKLGVDWDQDTQTVTVSAPAAE